jgi:hypothetical protein
MLKSTRTAEATQDQDRTDEERDYESSEDPIESGKLFEEIDRRWAPHA